MANTYTQINIHLVFAVHKRENLLLPHFETRLYEYMSGILKDKGHYPLAIHGHFDHVHLLFELNPAVAISSLAQIVKSNSARWINDEAFLPGRFTWQEGYGGFSYSRSQRNSVIKYIMNQHEHHEKESFKEEYLKMLKSFEIEFKDQYLFDFFD